MGLLAERIGALGVIVTLIYPATQIRHNTSAVGAATRQTQIDSTVPLNGGIATDEKPAALIVKANEDYGSLRPGEQIQLRFMYVNYYNLWHSAFWNRKENIRPNQAWRFWNNGMGGLLIEKIACRRAWECVQTTYDDDFQTHVNQLISKLETPEEIGSGVPLITKNVT